MTTRYLVIASLAAAMITAVTSDALASPFRFELAPVNNVVFEVGANGSGRSDELWCGAATYARRTLGAGWRSDVYVVRGRGFGEVTQRSVAAQFTLDPGAAGVTPIPKGQGFNTMAVGFSMSVQLANNLCFSSPDLSINR